VTSIANAYEHQRFVDEAKDAVVKAAKEADCCWFDMTECSYHARLAKALANLDELEEK